MKEGKKELTFGFSEARLKANTESINELFSKMNP